MYRAKIFSAPSARRGRARHRLTFLNTLLVTTAFTMPAFAQVETVVVTAERKAENIQTVPVAVTALTAQDLKAKQVVNFRDLQFHVPSVTYTKSNFGGAQFQIRGITTQFGLGAAISQNLDDIYLEAPNLVTGEYFDVDRVEVARGPQSTSYGRAATGGSVNIITTKPDLDNFSARASVDYGSFDTVKPDAAINVPIIDGELAARFAIHGDYHDGYERNIYNGPQIFPGHAPESRSNNLGTLDARFSVRWEPSADTTIDLVADAGYENDRRVRGDKQECHRDPSGVLGCLPDRLGFDPINTNATLGTTLGSAQGFTALLNTNFGVPFGLSQLVGNTLGVGTLAGNGGASDPAGAAGLAFLGARFAPLGPAPGVTLIPQSPEAVNGPGSNASGIVTPNILTTNDAFNPKYKTAGGTYLLNWQQTVTDWLSATVDAGYANGYQFTQQSYNTATPENISALISQAQNGFNITFGTPGGYPGVAVFANPNATAAYDSVLFNVPGSLPLSNTNYLRPGFRNYGGIIDFTRGGILTKTPFNAAYDEDWFGSRETTGEVRFQTKFDGPLNFSAGVFFMSYTAHNQYWVASPGLDFESAAIGASFAALQNIHAPLLLALPTFDSEYRRNSIISRSAFLEGTYEIIPDELKVIAGARFNDDRQHFLRTSQAVGGGLLSDSGGVANLGFFPLGSTFVDLPVTSSAPNLVNGKNVTSTDLWTGRVSVNWTPKLDFTDQTLVYATLSRGELAGGVNVSNSPTTSAIAPETFRPATVDALEAGTKNTLLDNTLTVNVDAWYYNYENYQLGIIANRQALTLNIPARLYGLEGEFLWQPTDELAFNLTVGLTQSHAGNVFLQDQRNPLAGNGPAGGILVKDVINGSNCVVVPISAAAVGHTPGESNATFHVNNFYLPNGGNAAIDAGSGIPLVNYGVCQPTLTTPVANSVRDQLQKAGFDYAPSIDPRTGGTIASVGDATSAVQRDGTGYARNLHGNPLPQVPKGQIGIGAQYTFKVDGGYTVVPRVDYYWQSSFESRVWNDPIIDRVNSWDTMNVNLQVNGPDNKWYAAVFAKNIFDKKNPTGVYLTDATSGLFTNVFAEDPRVVGISLGTSW